MLFLHQHCHQNAAESQDLITAGKGEGSADNCPKSPRKKK